MHRILCHRHTCKSLLEVMPILDQHLSRNEFFTTENFTLADCAGLKLSNNARLSSARCKCVLSSKLNK